MIYPGKLPAARCDASFSLGKICSLALLLIIGRVDTTAILLFGIEVILESWLELNANLEGN